MRRFRSGEVVSRREVLHRRTWLEQPVTVVSDDDVLAVRLDPGAPFTFPEHPFGAHPWSEHEVWQGSIVLQLIREGDPYAVWKVFDPDGSLRHWYVNFERPITRGEEWFEVEDHGLDLVIDADGRRTWKDVEDLHLQRASGRIDLETVGLVLEAAADVIALLDRDDRWWSPWDAWVP